MEQTNMERNDLNERNTIAGMEGEIRGLKFSIMCNGVSGGEINAAR